MQTTLFDNEQLMDLKVFRQQQGWSQETMAELSGLSTRTIQRIESGAKPSADSELAIQLLMDEYNHQCKEESMQTTGTSNNPTLEPTKNCPRASLKQHFYTHLAIFAILQVLLATLNVVLTPSFFWVWIPFLGWGAGLIGHAYQAFYLD